MIDIRGNQMDRTISHLKGISESFDLTIQDREAISTAIETIRERNKTVYIVTLLEALSKEVYCPQIFSYAVWKLVCGYIDNYPDPKIRKEECIKEFKIELSKWFVE